MPGSNIQIFITGSDSTTGELTLLNDVHTNRGRTNAGRGDMIIWHVDPNSGVDSITAIETKPGVPSINIFVSGDPRKPGSSAGFQGKIQAGIAVGSVFNYNIVWSGKDGSTNNVFDPAISVNS